MPTRPPTMTRGELRSLSSQKIRNFNSINWFKTVNENTGLFSSLHGGIMLRAAKTLCWHWAKTISATINGVPGKFDFIDSVGYSNNGTWYTMTVTGKSSAADSADWLELSVFSKTPITTGTYTFVPTMAQQITRFPPLSIVYKLKGSSNFPDDARG